MTISFEIKMDKSLTYDDIVMICGYKPNLIKYGDIVNYNHIDDILTNNACIILYETSNNRGHWCCIFKRRNIIEFFDPYGLPPDNQLLFISNSFRVISDQKHPILSLLLIKSPYRISYNQYQYQQYSPKISTCGRHVGIRLLLSNLSNDQYHTFITLSPLTPDNYIYNLTSDI
jgi:hypothetical protein